MGVEARLERARLLVLEAMLDPARWDAALEAIADACGARAGQLLAVDGARAVSGHWLTNVPDGFMGMIEAYGFANVSNPRFRAGLAAPLMTPVADQDYLSPEERRASAIYNEIYEPSDLPFNCQVVLQRDDSALVRASVTRTRKQGPLDAEAKRVFAAISPHLQAAVRMQAHLTATQNAATLLTLDAVGAAAFLLSESGRVIGASAAGEALAREGAALCMPGGMLRFCAHADQGAYEAALARIARRARAPAALAPIPLTGAALVLELQPLPRQRMSFVGAPAVLALLRPAKAPERAHMLRNVFQLTRAEAEIALAMADGEPLEAIAARRDVAIATVRTQVQAIYAKMDVHRQAELAAAVRRLGGEG